MKFACDSCQTKYTIADEKVRGKVLKIRCKKCGSVITVKEEVQAPAVPAELPVEERTRVADIGLLDRLRKAEAEREASPAAPEPPPIEWFAMINGAQSGPFSPSDLDAHISSGEVNDRTHVWRDGMADWKRASEVDELAAKFAPPPAPPLTKPATRSMSRPPPPAPAPVAAAPSPSLSNFDDDENLPTVARPMPNMAQLFADEPPPAKNQITEPEPETSDEPASSPLSQEFDDTPPPDRRNGSNGRAAEPELGDDPEPPGPSQSLADMMGDLGSDEHEPTGAGPVSVVNDPFAAVPDSPSMAKPTIGEQTKFFMKKAGVTNRNPWWKYVLFILLIVALPVAALYSLGKAGVGGTVMIYDAQTGEAREVQRFSLENVKGNGLAALLSGANKNTPPPAKKPTPAPQPKKAAATTDKKIVDPNAGDPKANLSAEDKAKLAANAGNDGKSLGLVSDEPNKPSGSGPIDHSKDTKGPAVDKGDQLSPDAVAKVVADSSTSFNKCVEDHLKRDPSWKGGRVNVSLKIGPSGSVLDSKIDKSDVANSDVGECLKSRFKHMKFPRFSGDDPQDVEFPLLLTNGG